MQKRGKGIGKNRGRLMTLMPQTRCEVDRNFFSTYVDEL